MTSKVVDGPGAEARPPVVRRLRGVVPAALGWALAELAALTGMAVAQPLLDVTGKAPDFFLLHRLSRGGILALVCLIVLGPPLLAWGMEVAVRLVAGERARQWLHLLLVAGLVGLLALEVGKRVLPLRGRKLALLALLVGLAAAWAHRNWAWLRSWLRYLAVAPLAFGLLFVTTSPSAKLILPSQAGGQSSPVPVRTSPGKPLPPVVLIFFDEFPLQSLLDSRGQVDGRVYPNFARFARDATWYRNATGVSGWTPYAVPAMLSGRYPDKSRNGLAPIVQAYPDNLFTLLGHYYDLKAFETVTQLCPPARCGQTGTPSGFGTVTKETAKLYDQIIWPADTAVDPATVGGLTSTSAGVPQGPTALFGNLGQNQPRRFEKFLSSISATDRQPTLYFLHVLLPHTPWRYLPDGRVYGDLIRQGPLRKKSGTWPDAVNQLGHQRQLLQLAYTDALVGKLLDRLEEQGLYDKSLVLMTADHGAGFSSSAKSRELGGGNEPTLMWVPLFVKAPRQTQGRLDDRNWEHVDLLPTIADTVGLSVPWKVDGFSEAGPPKRQRTEKWWYANGVKKVRPGPPNFQKVLHGVTDTLVRAHQNGARGFYQFGPDADWVYRSPPEVGRVTGASTQVTVKMTGWDRFKTVTPGSTPTPAEFVGEVTSGTPPSGSVMVIAVNDRIAGTASFYPPHEGESPTGFAMMVPDALFTQGPGQRQIQAYLATRSADGVTLQLARIQT
jgi:hypothetical protein